MTSQSPDVAKLANRVREVLNYDAETGVMSWRVRPKYSHCKIGQPAGYISVNHAGKSYLHLVLDQKFYSVHRLIWLHVHGQWPVDEIDHLNGNGLDNRLFNLREVPRFGNSKNRRLDITNKSGFVGVAWETKRTKWRAYLKINGRTKHLGYFIQKVDAAEAVRKACEASGFHPNHGMQRPL